jgi:hypothetical protein
LPCFSHATRNARSELESEAATEHQSEMQSWTKERAEAEIKRRAGEQNALKAAKLLAPE